jgi:hypothetical protein
VINGVSTNGKFSSPSATRNGGGAGALLLSSASVGFSSSAASDYRVEMHPQQRQLQPASTSNTVHETDAPGVENGAGIPCTPADRLQPPPSLPNRRYVCSYSCSSLKYSVRLRLAEKKTCGL